MQALCGNAIVGQSGGPTAAINATLSGVIRGAIAADCIGTVYGMRNGIEGLCEERLVDLEKIFYSEECFDDLEHTPAAALGSCRRKLPDLQEAPQLFGQILSIFKKYNIRYFFYIGGNDSMDTVHKLNMYTQSIGYTMRIMGVPKTIDNDLCGTDHTPGFGSAAKYIATSVQEILCDCAVYTASAITVIEIMGRDAGWLTASAALPRLCGDAGPDYIYLPERTFDMHRLFADVQAALQVHPYVVVAAAEGIKFSDGSYVCADLSRRAADAFGHTQLSGTGICLAKALHEALGCKTRAVAPDILQRCAAHLASATDLRESVAIGKKAVEYAIRGVTGHMMIFIRSKGAYTVTFGSLPVENIANKVRTLPSEFITPSGNDVTQHCLAYLRPLIQGEINYRHEAGLPVHFKI